MDTMCFALPLLSNPVWACRWHGARWRRSAESLAWTATSVILGLLISLPSWADVAVAEHGRIITRVDKSESALAGEDVGKTMEYLLEAYQLAESVNDYVASAVINNRVRSLRSSDSIV